MRPIVLLATLLLLAPPSPAAAQDTTRFTHADTLRGSNGPARAWWDATFYDLHVRVNPADSTIRGWNGITYRVLAPPPPPAREMQIDLQAPMEMDSVVQDRRKLTYRRDGNAFFVTLTAPQRAGDVKTLTVHYHGTPRVARRPPWDGGYTWTRDSSGGLWIATSNEGIGASVWWPNKDIPADEPDSQRIAITVPDPLVDVSNGRLRSTTPNADGTTSFEWFVTAPINNYNIVVNAGRYAHFGDTLTGEAGRLTLDFWPLAEHLEAARRQFQQVTPMLRCFEHWFGPYPWYEDGYKLIEAPHLGMEHQSGVAYGNHYQNGYLGRDLSRTGLGLMWDYIIIHESAHEWWGNNISAQDHADMWVHESFAYYAEGIYTECQQGRSAGAAYIIGSRRGIRNERPILGTFGVNRSGSGDMYSKGGNMLHTIRAIIDDDARWRGILRGLNQTFRRQTVTGQQVRDYISREAGIDLSKVFAQYLTTTKIPVVRVPGRGHDAFLPLGERRPGVRHAGEGQRAGDGLAGAAPDGGVAEPGGEFPAGGRAGGGRELLRHCAQRGRADGDRLRRPALTRVDLPRRGPHSTVRFPVDHRLHEGSAPAGSVLGRGWSPRSLRERFMAKTVPGKARVRRGTAPRQSALLRVCAGIAAAHI